MLLNNKDLANRWAKFNKLNLPQGVEVRLDPLSDTIGELCFYDQDCACYGTNLYNNGNDSDEMPFFNRTIELGFLIEPRNQFVILDGPAGYGKSYLLQKLQKIYKTEVGLRDKWLVASISLVSFQQDRERIKWLVTDIANHVQMKPESNHHTLDPDYVLLEIANYVKREGKALLVILDGIEQTSKDELIWLRYKLPYQLRSVLNANIRVILAGRHINRRIKNLGNISNRILHKERILAFEPCRLSPFDKGVVQQIVYGYRNDIVNVEDELLDHFVEEIFYLSGGHPQAIIELTDDLSQKSRWNWILQDRRFLPDVFRKELFQRCLYRVADNILARTIEDTQGPMLNGTNHIILRADLSHDLEIISLLRRFDVSLLIQLYNAKFISTEPNLLRGILISKGLSGDIDPKTGWQENNGIPRLLALRQRYLPKTRKECLKQNKQLHQIFHNRAIEALDTLSTGNFIRSRQTAADVLLNMCESLYHFFNQFDVEPQNQQQSQNILKRFAKLIFLYLDALEGYCLDRQNAIERLLGMINEDDQDDIRFLARCILGEEVWIQIHDMLMDSLNKYVIQVKKGNTKLKIKQGDGRMARRNVLDWLVDSLDLLRHNAQNVLVERWEKRNLGKATTPPVFSSKSLSREEIISLLPSEEQILAKMKDYPKISGSGIVISVDHIKSLSAQILNSQKTMDRYDVELSKALSITERVALEQQRDEAKNRKGRVEEELADIVVSLF